MKTSGGQIDFGRALCAIMDSVISTVWVGVLSDMTTSWDNVHEEISATGSSDLSNSFENVDRSNSQIRIMIAHYRAQKYIKVVKSRSVSRIVALRYHFLLLNPGKLCLRFEFLENKDDFRGWEKRFFKIIQFNTN